MLRPARREDAPFLAWIALASARSHLERGFWDLLISEGEAERLAFLERLALADPPSWWHWSLFLVAERDGRPVAALSGFDPAEPRFAKPDAAVVSTLVASGWSASRTQAGLARGEPFFHCVHQPEPGAWMVESVATRPEARGLGLAHELVERVLEDGRRRGHRAAQLSLLIGNAPAQRVYERLGFAIAAEKRDPTFEAALGCPGVARMMCRL
jgi:ribosomal protein S18 acetylase RimI-like enzyme